MVDFNFVPETLDWCKTHYVHPVERYIECPDFGNVDWMNGGCHWCHEMTPYQCEMCRDESHLRGLMSPYSKLKAKTREEAAEFIENYKKTVFG